MAIEMKLRFDLDRYNSQILPDKQARFAGVLLVSRLANDARDDVRARLPLIFRLRNRWTQRSIWSRRATKSDPTAIVQGPDYLAKQIEGGRVRPRGDFLATPEAKYRARKGIRRTAAQDLSGGAFFHRTPGGLSIRKRMGRGRGKLTTLYWLTGYQDFDQKLDFEGEVETSIQAHLAQRWGEALDYVARTAR